MDDREDRTGEGIDRRHRHLVVIIDRPDRVLAAALTMGRDHRHHPLADIIDHHARRIIITVTIIIMTTPLVVSGLLLWLVLYC